MNEKQTGALGQLLTDDDKDDGEFLFDPKDLDHRGDLLGIASDNPLTKATLPANIHEQYSMIPPAIWMQVDLQLAMGQAVTASQLQVTIAHLAGTVLSQDVIKHHVMENRQRLLDLRDEYLEKSFTSMKAELRAIATSSKAMRFQRIATALGALCEGMLTKMMEGKLSLSPTKLKTMVSAFDQLQSYDPMADKKAKDPDKKEDAISMVEAVVEKMTKGKDVTPGITETHADETLGVYMEVSDRIAAGPAKVEFKEPEDGETDEGNEGQG